MMPKLLASYVLFPSVGRKNMPDADAQAQNPSYLDVADVPHARGTVVVEIRKPL